jgi:hypothetical protein
MDYVKIERKHIELNNECKLFSKAEDDAKD